MKKIVLMLSVLATVCALTSCAKEEQPAPAPQPAPVADHHHHHHHDYKGEAQ